METSDFEFARQRLYKAKAGQPEYKDLQLRTGPDGKLWIVKGESLKAALIEDAPIELPPELGL